MKIKFSSFVELTVPIGMGSLYLRPWLRCQGLESLERNGTIVSYQFFAVL